MSMNNRQQAQTPVVGLTTALVDRGFGGPAVAMASYTPMETLPFPAPEMVPTVKPKKESGVAYGNIGNPDEGRVVHGVSCSYNGCSYRAKDSHGLAEHYVSHRRKVRR
jgi:hypothetical protein